MYISLADFETEFGSDDLPEDLARLDHALDRASRLVNTYCRASGLTVPLTDTNAIADIKGPCLDLARYFVWNDNPSEELRKRYEDAITFFEQVASGKIRLVAAGQTSTPSGFANIRLIRG